MNVERKHPEVEIQKVLVASTGHVTPAEAKLFDAGLAPNNHTVWLAEYGWMFYIGPPTGEDAAEWGEMSDGLRGVVETAWRYGVDWVKFDRDGMHLDGVPTYNW